MARRGVRPSVPTNPPKVRRPDGKLEPVATKPGRPVEREETDPAATAARLGERIRRVALGLTAALVTARAYTTSEPDLERGAGAGLIWVLALLIVAGLAIAAGLIGGRFRFRWSWADAAVVALVLLVAFSSLHALDRRPAINLAWEWIGLGIAYLLLRNLPRTRAESAVLAGAMVATAFAVSVYGLYQVGVELPALQAQFRRNPLPMLAAQDIAPGTPAHAQFANRLMQSNEPWSTFALTNSLAGYIVGPLVLALGVWLHTLADRDPARSRRTALVLAAPVILILAVCLMLTKSRSAYLGLLVGVGIVAWPLRRRVTARQFLAAGAAGLAIVVLLVAAGLKTGRLDRAVLTQSSLSMRYRWEFWQATWRVITGGATDGLTALKAAVLRWGVGPGNFRAAYLRYKLPESSEEILDPHNLFLEVWATAGFWAFLALVLGLILGLRELLGRSGPGERDRRDADASTERPPGPGAEDEPSRRSAWLVVSAGAAWVLVVVLGMMNLFESDMFPRWLILGASWIAAVLLGAPLMAQAADPGHGDGRGHRGRRGQPARGGGNRHPDGRAGVVVDPGDRAEPPRRPSVRPIAGVRESSPAVRALRRVGGCGRRVPGGGRALLAVRGRHRRLRSRDPPAAARLRGRRASARARNRGRLVLRPPLARLCRPEATGMGMAGRPR